jgi:hypothetical protein
LTPTVFLPEPYPSRVSTTLDVLEGEMTELNDQKPKFCPLNHGTLTIRTITVCSLVLFSLLACQDMFKGMGEMMVLQQRLAKEFNTQNVGVKITNSAHLGVTFHNSQMAKLPKFEQELKARQIALFVRDHYKRWRNLSTISVVSITKTQAAFSFKPSELGSGLPQV